MNISAYFKSLVWLCGFLFALLFWIYNTHMEISSSKHGNGTISDDGTTYNVFIFAGARWFALKHVE